jgi:Mpv17 / PMP22 family
MWSIVLMNWRIWPLANVLNFGLVPIQLQVLVNQLLSFFWCIYISTRIE